MSVCVCSSTSVSFLFRSPSYVCTHICTQCRSEKDASVWSKDKLRSLLIGLAFEGPEGACERTVDSLVWCMYQCVMDTVLFCSPFFLSFSSPSLAFPPSHSPLPPPPPPLPTHTGSCETTKIESIKGEASSKYVKCMNSLGEVNRHSLLVSIATEREDSSSFMSGT